MKTAALVTQFVTQGWVRLEGAFSPRFAAPIAKDALARYAALPKDGPAHDDRSVPLGVTLPHTRGFELAGFAPEAVALVHALAGGADRLADPSLTFSDGFVVAPPGSRKWRKADPFNFGWHIDGAQDALRRPDSPEVGLLLYALWTDTAPKGGGTFFAPGALPTLARHLATRDEGWKKADLPYWLCLEACRDPAYFEFTGKAGTMLITHPLLIHAASWNASKKARLLSVRSVPFKEPLSLGPPFAERTPVERATMTAIDASGQRRR